MMLKIFGYFITFRVEKENRNERLWTYQYCGVYDQLVEETRVIDLQHDAFTHRIATMPQAELDERVARIEKARYENIKDA